jgi:hypothetical protein
MWLMILVAKNITVFKAFCKKNTHNRLKWEMIESSCMVTVAHHTDNEVVGLCKMGFKANGKPSGKSI